MVPARLLSRLLYVATAINVVGLPIAVVQGEPWHATIHAVLALGCGFWAMRLGHPRRGEEGRELEGAGQPAELEAGGQGGMNEEWLRRQPEQEKQRPE